MVESLISVSTQYDLPIGTVLGPVPGSLGSLDPLVLIGLRCVDVRNAGQLLTVDLRKPDGIEINLYPDWMLHVQSARDSSEQNLEAVAHEGRLYFRSIKDVKANEELLVWYGSEISRALAIPSPATFLFKDDGKFTCPFCADAFIFPNPCSSHVAYRCDQRRQLPETRDVPKPHVKSSSSGFTIDFLSCSSHAEKKNKDQKRKQEPPEDNIPRKRDVFTNENIPCGPAAPSGDFNQQLTHRLTLRQEQWTSAFKKVNKNSSARPLTDGTSGTLKPLYSLSFPLTMFASSQHYPPVSNGSLLPSAFVPTAKFIPEPFGDAIKLSATSIEPEVSRTRVLPYDSSASYKMPMSYGKIFNNTQAQMDKFSVPPVTSLMPPSMSALSFPAQNWCAKCNASFRMTSDLVYHMRSHHKREVDPAKKRRDEKLKCSICHESFRERHHLTRHMTSHQ